MGLRTNKMASRKDGKDQAAERLASSCGFVRSLAATFKKSQNSPSRIRTNRVFYGNGEESARGRLKKRLTWQGREVCTKPQGVAAGHYRLRDWWTSRKRIKRMIDGLRKEERDLR